MSVLQTLEKMWRVNKQVSGLPVFNFLPQSNGVTLTDHVLAIWFNEVFFTAFTAGDFCLSVFEEYSLMHLFVTVSARVCREGVWGRNSDSARKLELLYL